MKRYEMVYEGGHNGELVEADDGEWVRYEECAGIIARVDELEKALTSVNSTIYAVGAPFGSEKYFEVRNLCVNALRGNTPATDPATDPVVEANRQLLLDRSRVGMLKYGTTLDSASLSHAELTQHALEEALDLANYLQATLRKLGAEPPAAQTEDLAGAGWDGPNTASQVDLCMGLPAKGRG